MSREIVLRLDYDLVWGSYSTVVGPETGNWLWLRAPRWLRDHEEHLLKTRDHGIGWASLLADPVERRREVARCRTLRRQQKANRRKRT